MFLRRHLQNIVADPTDPTDPATIAWRQRMMKHAFSDSLYP